MAEKVLYLIRGLPGSGKSTTSRHIMNSLSENGVESYHWEADMFFVDRETGAYNFDASLLHSAHNWCQQQTKWCMNEGHTVIVSNTFTTQSEMKPYFELAVQYDYKVVVLTCKSRFKNVHDVPQEALDRMRKRFDYTAEDTLYEIYFPNT